MSDLVEYSDQQLLGELLRRANQRDGMALGGHGAEKPAVEPYIEVVPVAGAFVPAMCEWRARDDEGIWYREWKQKFSEFDEKHRNAYYWRAPV